MLKNKLGIIKDCEEIINIPRLIFITAILAIGAVAGSIYAVKTSDSELLKLFSMHGAELFKWLSVINIAFVFLIYVSSYFASGHVFAIMVLAAKGFVFSVPITENVKLYGINGYFGGLGISSVCCILSVLAVIIMAMQSVELSSKRRLCGDTWKNKEEDVKNTLMIFMAGSAAIIFGAAADAYLLK